MGPGGYEFTQLENQTIDKTATWCKYLAFIFFAQAALELIDLNVIGVGIDVAIGIAFFQGAKAMKSVVDTQGHDIPHMMEAMRKLATAVNIRIWVTIIAVVLIALVVIFAGAMVMALAESLGG